MFKTTRAAALAVILAATPAAAEDVRRLVTVLTDPNPQTQLMGMVLTNEALAREIPTRILLCGPAADIALKDAPDTATAPQPPKGASPQGLLQAAMAKGARAEVCALYLPGKGLTPEALIEGVGVAQPPAMAKTLADRRARIWSF